jgi:hypothetical protein
VADTVRIDRLYAYIVVDETDNMEGLPAFADPRTGMWMPMVGADEARMASLLEIAQDTADDTGKEIVYCVFERRVEIGRITPKGSNGDNT